MGLKTMNKKGLEFKSAFFALILVGIVVTAVGIQIDTWNTDYGSGLDYDLDAYDKSSSVSNTAGEQKEDITVRSSGQGEQFEDTSIRGAFGVLNNIFTPFRIVFGEGGMIDSITDRWGVPDYIRQGIIAMMVIAITFTLIAIIFRRSTSSA